MVRDIDGDIFVEIEGADRDRKDLREGLISLMLTITGGPAEANDLGWLAWNIRELKDE